MVEKHLTARIYIDTAHPEISPEIAADGLEIVRSIYPWVRLSREVDDVETGQDACINGRYMWPPKLAADINIVLTEKTLVQEKVEHPGKIFSLLAMAGVQEYSGLAFSRDRVNSNRVAIINTTASERPDQIVAHEVGHLFGVRKETAAQHCDKSYCLMHEWPMVRDRFDRMFCECCSDQFHANAGRLALAKRGPTPKAPNAKVF